MAMSADLFGTAWSLYRKETTVDEIVKDYIVDKFSAATSPSKRAPDIVRFEHLLATGRSGCGKSSYLYGLMAKDIPLALAGKRTMIVVDPVTGIDKIVKETGICMAPNVFLIDPADPDSLPRLNLFETGVQRKGILQTTHMINTFKSVCAGLINQELTPNMETLFGRAARVMMYVDNPTLHDLLELLRDPLGFMELVGCDCEETIDFFQVDVVGVGKNKGSFTDTVKYVRGRVHGFLNDPIISQLLINKHPTLKLSKVIESGSILLVATRKSDLGEDGCRLLGKFIKAIVNRVAQERNHDDIDKAVPIMFYEDEFQNSLNKGYDKGLATMLDENRKFKLSMNLATTRFGHLNTDMADAVMTCTATKVCGTMASKGAHFIAAELRRPAEELINQPKFSLFVKVGAGKDKAIVVKSEKDPFKKLAKNDPKAMKKLRQRMNARFGESYVKRRDKRAAINRSKAPTGEQTSAAQSAPDVDAAELM